MRRTFKDNPWDVSIGAIFLASKIEFEYTSRISRYLIHECARAAKKIADPKFELNKKEKEYGYWKNNMLYYETEILRVLYYDLNVDEPYSISGKWCKEYKVSIEEESIINYLLNESYIKTLLCLQYPSKTIAAGAFVLATLDNKNINWKKWKKNINLSTNDIKDVSLKLKDMLIKNSEKSPSDYHHKYLSHKSFSLQDFVKSPSPLKISSMNNDIDKNSTDNKNINDINITKTQLLSSPPKSDNSDHLEKDNQKNSKISEENATVVNIEENHSLNENEDWEVVDMDIDDDEDDAIPNPNPNPNSNTNVNIIIKENKETEIKQDNLSLNDINSNININDDRSISYINNPTKYDNYKIKNNYPFYSNSRKHYPPPPPPTSFHYSRSRSRGGNNYSYHYSYSRPYSNNYSNSGQNYYNRNNSSSYYRSSTGRNIGNSKLSNSLSSSNNNNITSINSTSNINNVSPNQPKNPNYYPQY
jgi:hypothetical protein